MKIAHVQLLPLLSGVQRVSLQELERLPASQFERFLICKELGELTDKCEKLGVKTLVVPSLVRNINVVQDVLSFFRLIKIFKRNKFDIVHTHSSKTGFLGRLAAKISGTPLVVHTVHGFAFSSTESRILKRIYHLLELIGGYCSDVVICLHEEDKKIAIEKLMISPDKIVILPNGVDIKTFSPAPLSPKKEKRFVIGMVGRLWPQKDPMTLLKAAFDILQLRNDIEFRFLGGGELEHPMSKLIEKNGFSDAIKLLGWKDDVNNQLKMLDVFVLPSLWEGMPLAILEAQSTQLPCVVSNIPGNNHLVKHEFDGLLFEPGNSDDLVQTLIRLLDDQIFCSQISFNARKKIVDSFDIDNRISKVVDIYCCEMSRNKIR